MEIKHHAVAGDLPDLCAFRGEVALTHLVHVDERVALGRIHGIDMQVEAQLGE